MTRIMKVQFAGTELMTGLPEYRNGGLLVDTGLLNLREVDQRRGLAAYKENAALKGQPNFEVVPLFATDDDVIVEWRAVTVGFLDDLLIEVNSQLGLSGPDKLSLAQMLEAGTWKVSLLPHLPRFGANTIFAGRTRIGRGFKAKHQGASYHDHFGRHGILSIFFALLFLRPLRLRASSPSSFFTAVACF